jgi:hypothetical protein
MAASATKEVIRPEEGEVRNHAPKKRGILTEQQTEQLLGRKDSFIGSVVDGGVQVADLGLAIGENSAEGVAAIAETGAVGADMFGYGCRLGRKALQPWKKKFDKANIPLYD